ncbi:glycosyl transferase family 1 [Cupriavidus sp. USMAHM13]|uniref:glycosyltransferase n=1 Tax=Cupriavidus sp. USMAHM13 TaxID=1389192 RepID=UPI0008A67CDF|nr:glycosyltransferase [Cupriavidus sp. USMAHM13]AOZ00571.1 glycosyl transferase family 1 [Cupriavidus sp. USMAHM13]
MRILLLTTGLKLGGAEQQVAALARQFGTLGHTVAIVSLTPGCDVAIPDSATVEMLDMRKTPLSMATALARARNFVRRWRPDVIHAHMVHANLFARVLGLLCRNVPIICSAHSAQEGGQLRMLAYRLTDGLATHNTHVSESGKQAMVAAGAVPASHISVMPNGIDTARFRPDNATGRQLRAALRIPAEVPLVLNVGRLAAEKNQAGLIDAFALARRDSGGTPARLLIVGEGPERASLQARIREHGLQHAVTLAGARGDIPALLNAADLFVLSSVVEGLPLALAEALACGCPVVATDAAGAMELMGETGTIVPVADTLALAAAIRDALRLGRGTDAAQWSRRQRITDHFDLDLVARRWLTLYADAKRSVRAPQTRPA